MRRRSCYWEAQPGVGGRGLSGVHALLFPCVPNGNTQVYFQSQVPRDTSLAFRVGLPSPTCQPLNSRGFCRSAGLGLASEGGSPGAGLTQSAFPDEELKGRLRHHLLCLALEPRKRWGSLFSLSPHPPLSAPELSSRVCCVASGSEGRLRGLR